MTAQPRDHLVPAAPRPGEAVEQDEGLGHGRHHDTRPRQPPAPARAGRRARALRIAGACTSPGSRSAPLVLALVRDGRFPCFSHVDERSAGFFALGLAKETGAPGRPGLHLGHGGGQLPPRDHRGARGARPARRPHRRPPARAARHRRRADHRPGQALRRRGQALRGGRRPRGHRPSACAGSARWPAAPCGPRSRGARASCTSTCPCASRSSSTSRWADDRGARRRAGRPTAALGRALDRPGAAPDPRAGAETLARIAGAARRGVVVAGREERGRRRRPARSPRPRRPAFARRRLAAAGRPAVGRAHRPDAVAHYDALLRAAAFAGAARPEVVLRVGDLPTSKPLRQWLAGLDAVQVLLDPDGAWQDPAQAADLVLPTSPPACWRRWPTEPTAADPTWAGRVDGRRPPRGRRDRRDARRRAVRAAPGRRARRAASPEATLVVASSMPVRDLETFSPARDVPPRVLSNRGANGIDGTLATAYGVGRRRRARSWRCWATSPSPTTSARCSSPGAWPSR